MRAGRGTPKAAGSHEKRGERHGAESPFELPEGTNAASIAILDLLASRL